MWSYLCDSFWPPSSKTESHIFHFLLKSPFSLILHIFLMEPLQWGFEYQTSPVLKWSKSSLHCTKLNKIGEKKSNGDCSQLFKNHPLFSIQLLYSSFSVKFWRAEDNFLTPTLCSCVSNTHTLSSLSHHGWITYSIVWKWKNEREMLQWRLLKSLA